MGRGLGVIGLEMRTDARCGVRMSHFSTMGCASQAKNAQRRSKPDDSKEDFFASPLERNDIKHWEKQTSFDIPLTCYICRVSYLLPWKFSNPSPCQFWKGRLATCSAAQCARSRGPMDRTMASEAVGACSIHAGTTSLKMQGKPVNQAIEIGYFTIFTVN